MSKNIFLQIIYETILKTAGISLKNRCIGIKLKVLILIQVTVKPADMKVTPN